MLDMKQIESFYPEHLRIFKKNLLREYIQYKILEIIFNSAYGSGLAFMGGTAIHIIHKQLAKDVEPFLFRPADSKKVLLFPDHIEAIVK